MEANPRKLLDEFIPESIGKQFVIPVYHQLTEIIPHYF